MKTVSRIHIFLLIILLLVVGSCSQPFGAFMANRALLSFTLTEAADPGDIGDGTVSLTVPFGTDVTALVPSFTFLGQVVRVGTEVQTSGGDGSGFYLAGGLLRPFLGRR